ncbi:MAG: hypothetical protein ACWA6Y_09320 [Polaromonas sp.]
MNSSIENFTQQYGSAYRLESAVKVVKKPVRQGFSGSRSLFALLFSAVTAAGLVVSYEVMDSVEEGHLLVMWMALWYVAFAALAMLAGTVRQIGQHLKANLDQWSRNVAAKRADQRLWNMAKSDPRLMADLQAAKLLKESQGDAHVAWEHQVVKAGPSIVRDYTNGYGYV